MTQNKKPFQWIEKLISYAYSHSIAVLVITLIFFVFAYIGIRNLRIELDLYESHNNDFPSLSRLWVMREEFKDFSTMNFLIQWPTEPTGDQICQLTNKLSELTTQIPDTKIVFHLFKLRKIDSEPEAYWFPLALKDPCDYPKLFKSQITNTLEEGHPFTKWKLKSNEFMFQVKFKSNSHISSVGKWIIGINNSQYKSHSIGPVVFQYYIDGMLKKDSIFHLALIIFLLVFFKVVVGTWKSGGYYLATLATTFYLLAGFMGYFNLPIDVLTNSLFLVTAIAGTADYFFVCWGMINGKSLKESIHYYSRPALFTTLTTMIGFLSLCISDLETIKRFGLAAAIGAGLEWIINFIVLPAFINWFKLNDKWAKRPTNSILFEKINLANHWTPKPLLVIGFSIFILLGPYLFSQLRFEENPSKNFPSSHLISQSLNEFHQKMGWQNSIYIQFPRSVPEVNLNQCLIEIGHFPLIASVDNPFLIRDYFLKGLTGLRQESVLWNLETYGLLQNYFSKNNVRSLLYLKSNAPADLLEINQLIKAKCPPQTTLVGQSEVYREVSDILSRTLLESFVVSLVIVSFIIFYLQRKLKNREYFLLPISILSGPLFMISIMVIFDITISPFNSMFLAILVGMTGDNAIQYLFSGESGDLNSGLRENGPSSIIIAILMFLCSLFFLFQTLIPMRILGILFATGFCVNLFGDLWLLKGLLNLKNYLMNRSTAPKTGAAPKE